MSSIGDAATHVRSARTCDVNQVNMLSFWSTIGDVAPRTGPLGHTAIGPINGDDGSVAVGPSHPGWLTLHPRVNQDGGSHEF
jgi:hypothetical protein